MMELILKKYKGKPTEVKATFRKAVPSEIDVFYDFQMAVREAMPRPELYYPSSKEELLYDLTESLSIGAWVGDELIAYCIIRYCGEDEHNYANYLDVPKEDFKYWANGDSVVVANDYRGNHLQQELMKAALEDLRPEIIGIGCTISPENSYSLNNAKAMGFEVHTRRLMYGKNDRFVLKKQLYPRTGMYCHFKGNRYRVLSVAHHSETLEPMVVYQALYGEGGIWVRPAEMWFEHIDRGDYHGPRFRYIAE